MLFFSGSKRGFPLFNNKLLQLNIFFGMILSLLKGFQEVTNQFFNERHVFDVVEQIAFICAL